MALRYDVKSNDRDLDQDLYEYHRRNHMKDEYEDLIENLIREISEGEYTITIGYIFKFCHIVICVARIALLF